MSVYTTLDKNDLSAFLQAYQAGTLVDFEGISEGIENTNYFVNTQQASGRQSYVLTVFESIGFDELPYFLELMAFLAEHDIPCAHPVASRDGAYLQTLKGKPAALVQRLPGRGISVPIAEHCAQVGGVLARFHLAGRAFPQQRKNPRGPDWNRETAAKLHGKLTPADRDLLDRELNYQQSQNPDTLPGGVIHADLFRDNALFTGDILTGVIDLYYACSGPFLYDLAITVNDWCSLDHGGLNQTLADALIAGYQRHRPIMQEEQQRWEAMLRAGALRFWLSRLLDQHFPRSGELTHIKDPDRFKNILIQRIQEQPRLNLD